MKVLVTGGTGFVGGHLIRQLRAEGNHVCALIRPNSDRRSVAALDAEIVTGDLDDLDSLRIACEGCEAVYHSAARVEIVGDEDQFLRTTVAGTARMVAAAREKKVRRFIQISSCGVYAPALLASGQEINEQTPTTEPPRWFAYGRAKYHAENIVREKAGPDMDWAIVRLGYLYGPGNRTMHTYLRPVMNDPMMMIVGTGDNEMALVYVEDAVRAVVLAGRTPAAAGKVLIAGGAERITQRQYFDALADGFGLPRIKKHVPYKVAFFFAWLGEHVVKSGPRQAVMRRSAIALTGLPQRVRCDYTQRLLGWRPQVRFADGIRKAFDWYNDEYVRQANPKP